jgi:hypothetical protein
MEDKQERTKKPIWYVNEEDLKVEFYHGFSTGSDDVWWVPMLHCSLTLGYQIFESKEAAERDLKKKTMKNMGILINRIKTMHEYLIKIRESVD